MVKTKHSDIFKICLRKAKPNKTTAYAAVILRGRSRQNYVARCSLKTKYRAIAEERVEQLREMWDGNPNNIPCFDDTSETWVFEGNSRIFKDSSSLMTDDEEYKIYEPQMCESQGGGVSRYELLIKRWNGDRWVNNRRRLHTTDQETAQRLKQDLVLNRNGVIIDKKLPVVDPLLMEWIPHRFAHSKNRGIRQFAYLKRDPLLGGAYTYRVVVSLYFFSDQENINKPVSFKLRTDDYEMAVERRNELARLLLQGVSMSEVITWRGNLPPVGLSNQRKRMKYENPEGLVWCPDCGDFAMPYSSHPAQSRCSKHYIERVRESDRLKRSENRHQALIGEGLTLINRLEERVG